jgi:hypothetical protein
MSKALSQNAIGRAMNPPMSSANMVKLKKQGCPMDSVESVEAWRKVHQNIAQRKPDASDATRTNEARLDGSEMAEAHAEARTRREIAEANIAEIKEAELSGQYVEKASVDHAVFEAARGLRDGMTNCSRRLAAEVSNLLTPSECEAVITKELRHLLDTFSKQLAQKLTPATSSDSFVTRTK